MIATAANRLVHPWVHSCHLSQLCSPRSARSPSSIKTTGGRGGGRPRRGAALARLTRERRRRGFFRHCRQRIALPPRRAPARGRHPGAAVELRRRRRAVPAGVRGAAHPPRAPVRPAAGGPHVGGRPAAAPDHRRLQGDAPAPAAALSNSAPDAAPRSGGPGWRPHTCGFRTSGSPQSPETAAGAFSRRCKACWSPALWCSHSQSSRLSEQGGSRTPRYFAVSGQFLPITCYSGT